MRSDHRSIVRLLLIGSLRSHLGFSASKSQSIDAAIADWRDKCEQEYVSSEKTWTARKLYDRLLKHDRVVRTRVDETLSDHEKRRLTQVIIQLKGVVDAFNPEGSKLLGVSKKQIENAAQKYVAHIRSKKRRDPKTAIDDLLNHGEWRAELPLAVSDSDAKTALDRVGRRADARECSHRLCEVVFGPRVEVAKLKS